jgi:homoserine dehydrogenase
MKTYRLILTGLGNVGRNFLRILHTQANVLHNQFGVQLNVVAVADSTGGAVNPAGLDSVAMHEIKVSGKPISSLPRFGKAGLTGLELAQNVEADFLLEATPVNLHHGQPGLDIVRAALRRNMHCVLANKGPLALAYQELAALAQPAPVGTGEGLRALLRFSGCVGGALPTINIGWRDLAGARITKIEAMVNGTCQGILRLMEAGHSFAAALAEMQRRGVVEADPSLDIDGWDEAVKLVIIANAVLGRPTTLNELSVRGIRAVTLADLHAAAARQERMVLLGTAEPHAGDWRFSVAPVALPISHPLARMGGDEMGVVYHTDIAGTICATSTEVEATPTAAAMLRDVLEIARFSGS